MLGRSSLFLSLFASTTCLLICDENWSKFGLLRVIGGKPQNETWPNFYVAVISYMEGGMALLCGGTVIDDYYVLTAAHCISNPSRSYVLAGPGTLSKPGHVFRIAKTVVHPEFSMNTIQNDLAIIKTSTSLFKKGIGPVCIPRNDSYWINQGKATVAGFGLRILNASPTQVEMSSSDVVLTVDVPIISENNCKSKWQTLSLGTVIVSDNQICAGDYMEGSAPGDSGGPLFIQSPFGTIQLGITSFGGSGVNGLLDQKRFPGVYTRVSSYLDWIENVIASSNSFKCSFFVIGILSIALL